MRDQKQEVRSKSRNQVQTLHLGLHSTALKTSWRPRTTLPAEEPGMCRWREWREWREWRGRSFSNSLQLFGASPTSFQDKRALGHMEMTHFLQKSQRRQEAWGRFSKRASSCARMGHEERFLMISVSVCLTGMIQPDGYKSGKCLGFLESARMLRSMLVS